MGWTGTMRAVLHYLGIVGADRGEDGGYLVRGEVLSFMGVGGPDAEVVVTDGTVYFVDGRACNLAAGLASTSGGVAVAVY